MNVELEELLKCKSFTEVKKNYTQDKMIALIKKYMKNDALDYDAEIEKKIEECNEISNF